MTVRQLDVSGRRVRAELVNLAERYVAKTGSTVPAFELALLASADDRLRRKIIDSLAGGGDSDDGAA